MDQTQYHTHNGVDTPQINTSDLFGVPISSITAKNTDSPGATYSSTEQAIISNLQSRVNDLESRLQSLGLIQ